MIRLMMVLMVVCSCAHAQQNGPAGNGCMVWKKRVSRRVPVRRVDLYDTKFRSPDWNSFFQRLTDAAASGKIEALDQYTKEPLPPGYVAALVALRIDTIQQADDSGRFKKVLMKTPFNYDYVYKLRLDEEWTYDLATGKTTIEITHVSPMRDVFGEDGEYRGSASMFSIKWTEFLRFMSGENRRWSDSIYGAIWRDYFRDAGIVAAEKTDRNRNKFASRAVRRITLRDDTCGVNEDPNLYSTWDTSSGEILINNVRKGLITAYKPVTDKQRQFLPPGEGMPSAALTIPELGDMIKGKTDTQEVDDPVTQERIIKIIHHDFDFWSIAGYYVAEQWSFDPGAGVTTIHYSWIAPKQLNFNNTGLPSESLPMFWLHYEDAARSLRQYNDYMQRCNMEWQLWNDRFNERRRR